MSEDLKTMDQTEKNILEQNFFKNLPKYYNHCKEYLIVIDEFVVCVLCCKEFPIYSYDQQQIKYRYIRDHLSKDGHMKRDLELMSVGVDRLFNYIVRTKSYNKEFISKHFDKIYCKLCEISIDVTHDDLKQLSSLNAHLDGMHKDVFFNELIQNVPDTESVLHLFLKGDQVRCTLCLVNVKITSKLENTICNLKKHIMCDLHCQKLQDLKYRNERWEVKQNSDIEDGVFMINEIFSNIPEINRSYMMMHKTGKFFCQLCDCFVDLRLDSVLSHINLSNHAQLIQEVSSTPIIVDESNKINTCLKLMEEREKNALKKYSVPEREFLNSQIEFKPLYVEGEKNAIYTKLMKVLQPEMKQILEQNRYYIYLKNSRYNCSLCFERLDPEIFFEHLNEFDHVNRMKQDVELFPSGKTDQSYEHLKLILDHKLFNIVETNFCYLQKMGNIYICTLCSICFQVEPNLRLHSPENFHMRKSVTVDFTKHLNSFCHILAVKSHRKYLKAASMSTKYGDDEKESDNKNEQEAANTQCESLDFAKGSSSSEKLLPERNSSSMPKAETSDPVLSEYTVATYEAYKTLCDAFNTEIPEIVEENMQFLVNKRRKYLMCLLCKVDFKITTDTVLLEKVLSDHIKSVNHTQAFKSHLETSVELHSLFSCSKKFLFPNFDYKYLTDIFGSTLPEIVEKNKTLILVSERKVFVCKLCKSLLAAFSENEHPGLKFSKHFKCNKHKDMRREFLINLLKFEEMYLNVDLDKQYSTLIKKIKHLSSAVDKKPSILKTFSFDEKLLSDFESDKTPSNMTTTSEIRCNTAFMPVKSTCSAGIEMDKPPVSSFKNTSSSKNKELKDNTKFASLFKINKVPVTDVKHLFDRNVLDREQVPPLKDYSQKKDLASHNLSMKATSQRKDVASCNITTLPPSSCTNRNCGPTISDGVPTSSLKEQLSKPDEKYLRMVFGDKLPKIIYDNKEFLTIYRNGCLCALCDVFMEVPNTVKKALPNFSQHLESYRHLECVKISRRGLTKSTSSSYKSTYYNSLFQAKERNQNLFGSVTVNKPKPLRDRYYSLNGTVKQS